MDSYVVFGGYGGRGQVWLSALPGRAVDATCARLQRDMYNDVLVLTVLAPPNLTLTTVNRSQ